MESMTALQRRRWLAGSLAAMLFLIAIVLWIVGVLTHRGEPAAVGGILMAPCIVCLLFCVDWSDW